MQEVQCVDSVYGQFSVTGKKQDLGLLLMIDGNINIMGNTNQIINFNRCCYFD